MKTLGIFKDSIQIPIHKSAVNIRAHNLKAMLEMPRCSWTDFISMYL